MKVYGTQLVLTNAEREALGLAGHEMFGRAVVAAPNRTAAAAAFGVSSGDFKAFGSETGNPTEIAQAHEEPGVVFISKLDGPRATRRWLRRRGGSR